MKTKTFIILVLLIVIPTMSHSDNNEPTQDGYGLKKQADAYDLVKKGDKRPNVNNAAMYHLGYISGVYDILINALFICRTGKVTRGQVIEIVNNYVRSNPDKLHMQASDLVYSALLPAFPCKK